MTSSSSESGAGRCGERHHSGAHQAGVTQVFVRSTVLGQLARTVPALGLLALAACTTPPGAAPLLTPQRIADIVASPDRTTADRANDVRRKPEQMLAFIGVRPGMTVLDLSAGGGYTTELLARAVAPGGVVYGQSAPRDAARPPPVPVAPEGAAAPTAATTATATAGDSAPPSASMPTPAVGAAAPAARPAGPRPSPVALAERAARLGAAANIVAVVQPFEAPVPAALASGGLDLVTLMFNYHDLGFLGVDRARMNRALFAALKPGGAYVVADHAGRAGTGISESGTLHRIEQDFLRREVETAGFRFVAEAGFLRNPADPRDRNTPEPPQPKDDFVIKFIKP